MHGLIIANTFHRINVFLMSNMLESLGSNVILAVLVLTCRTPMIMKAFLTVLGMQPA